MNKSDGGGGVGIGSASIVLVFAVLCLTVFSLITLIVAVNDKNLVDAEAKLVEGYYEADRLAEQVAAEIRGIITAGGTPDNVRGIDVQSGLDWDLGVETASFRCPISESKDLYVRLAFYSDTYEVLVWRMADTNEWVFDDSLNIWQGDDDIFGLWLGQDDITSMWLEP